MDEPGGQRVDKVLTFTLLTHALICHLSASLLRTTIATYRRRFRHLDISIYYTQTTVRLPNLLTDRERKEN